MLEPGSFMCFVQAIGGKGGGGGGAVQGVRLRMLIQLGGASFSSWGGGTCTGLMPCSWCMCLLLGAQGVAGACSHHSWHFYLIYRWAGTDVMLLDTQLIKLSPC